MLRVSDYQPVKVPLKAVSQLQYLHWRTQWLPSEANDLSSDLVRVTGAGTSTWEVALSMQSAWLAWDWWVLDSGLIALANPLEVRSNAILLGDDGQLLTIQESAVILVSLVHGLPWRQEVEQLLHTAPALVH
jgi:hypothetical protein